VVVGWGSRKKGRKGGGSRARSRSHQQGNSAAERLGLINSAGLYMCDEN